MTPLANPPFGPERTSQRPTSCCRCSGYRAPLPVILETALSMSLISGRQFDGSGCDVLFQAMQLVGWVERSDTHQLQLAKVMGFAKDSTHPMY
jgi:hypothetical protein